MRRSARLLPRPRRRRSHSGPAYRFGEALAGQLASSRARRSRLLGAQRHGRFLSRTDAGVLDCQGRANKQPRRGGRVLRRFVSSRTSRFRSQRAGRSPSSWAGMSRPSLSEVDGMADRGAGQPRAQAAWRSTLGQSRTRSFPRAWSGPRGCEGPGVPSSAVVVRSRYSWRARASNAPTMRETASLNSSPISFCSTST